MSIMSLNCLFLPLSLHRQFTAALADLHEAAKLCPNNREIRRLLARVEEECKQMQRTQTKPPQAGAAAASNQASGGHDSDHEQQQEDGEEEPSEHSLTRGLDSQRDMLEEEDEDDASQHDRRAEACWSQNIYSLNRVLPADSLSHSQGHQSQNSRPGSPPGPSRLAPHRYPREALAQQGLVLQPTKQAQIVKTNQHMSSMQAGGGAGGSRSMGTKSQSQYAPSSPLPSRHMSSMLKAGPGIDISPLPPPADEPVYGDRMSMAAASTSMGHHCDNESLHSSQASYSSCNSSKGPSQERLSAHSVSSLDGLACSGPGPQGNHVDPGKEGVCGAAGGGSSIRVSSSTSSLASSSSLSDNGKLGPDVRTKTSDKAKHSQQGGATAEYKPRPFMGIMDKKARFQLQLQQQQQLQQQMQQHQGLQAASRSWQSHSSEGLVCHGMSAMGLQPLNCELSYAKTASTYQEQHKPLPPQGAMAMGSLQNGTHSKEFTEKFCQAATCYKESKPAMALPHTYMDSKPKQPGLARDNPAIHVASMKPKRSFIESNV